MPSIAIMPTKPIGNRTANRGHRKKIEIDFELLEKYCKWHYTLSMCSYMFGVSEDTIERRIKEKTGQTFAEYASYFSQGGKTQLINVIIDEALNKRNQKCIDKLSDKWLGYNDTVTIKQENVSEDVKWGIELLKNLVIKKNE